MATLTSELLMQQIDDDPVRRIAAPLRSLLRDPEHAIDVHTHLFTEECLAGCSGLLKAFSMVSSRSTVDRLLEVLNLKTMEDIAEMYQKEFAPRKSKTVHTALMIDFEFAYPSKKGDMFYKQVCKLNQLGKEGKILPFLGVDPRRLNLRGKGNLRNLFLQAFGEGGYFTGVKLFPCIGFLPSHPGLMELFEICEAKSIPVTTHCGGPEFRAFWGETRLTGTVSVPHRFYSPQKILMSQWENHRLAGTSRSKADYLNDPRQWLPVLLAFPDLKLNLGHLGGAEHWKRYFRKGKDQRLEDIWYLMDQFPHVYGDFSGFPLHPHAYRSFLEDSKYSLLRERALFGTDFWITLSLEGLMESILFYKMVTPPEWRKRFEQDNPRDFLFSRTASSGEKAQVSPTRESLFCALRNS